MSKSTAARGFEPTFLSACLALALLPLGCTQEPRETPPLDCSVEQAYEFLPLFMDPEPATNWYAAGDLHADLPGSAPDVAITKFDGSVCENTVGMVFTAGLNHDWGSVAGRWQALSVRDASDYDGLSFWGLSVYDHSIEMILSDVTSADLGMECIPDSDPTTRKPNPDYADANGIPVANGCGSAFSRRLMMSKSWTLYTLPFSDFYQNTLDPRFKPGGIDSSDIWQISFRVPKDSFIENTFVNFAWYRKAPAN